MYYVGNTFIVAFSTSQLASRLEPNFLKNLPAIPSKTSQNFYQLFLFYSHTTTNYSFLFYCVNDISQCRSDYIFYIVNYIY